MRQPKVKREVADGQSGLEAMMQWQEPEVAYPDVMCGVVVNVR